MSAFIQPNRKVMKALLKKAIAFNRIVPDSVLDETTRTEGSHATRSTSAGVMNEIGTSSVQTF